MRSLSLFALILAAPALAETRQMDAHEHGVGQLNIAVDGKTVAMELHAPGADIVGFEYHAESAEDREAVDSAVAALAKPLDLFVIPAAAECSVTQASAKLESEEDHEDHAAHDDHDHDEHKHDDHAEHKDEDHADHKHDAHAEEAGHTEFHAEYTLTCANTDALGEITFAYFDQFPNARELEVQIITAAGAQAFEVERDAPTLDLRSMF